MYGSSQATKDASTLFFVEKDLFSAEKLKIDFSINDPNFLLYNYPQLGDGEETNQVKKIIRDCLTPTIKGEKKYCATSVQSMVEFIMSTLGTNQVKVLSTSVTNEDTPPQQYTVMNSLKVATTEEELVSCHSMEYGIFYCHTTISTEAYTVEMVGDDGTKVKAAVVCHTDTKEMNPNHVAFKVLNAKPGTGHICHFFPFGHLLWMRNTQKNI